MTEHTEPTPQSDKPRLSLDSTATASQLGSLAEHQAEFQFMRNGQFLAGVNDWLDRRGEDTISRAYILRDKNSSVADLEMADRLSDFVFLLTGYADSNYLSESTESHDFDDYRRWVNVSHEGKTYQVAYMVGLGTQTWVTRLKEPLPADVEVLELETIMRGDKTERAQAIDAKLAQLATFAASLLEEGVPAYALSSKLVELSEEFAEK